MNKLKTKYVCHTCGHESLKWLGRCPGCQEWNSFIEEIASGKSRMMSRVTNEPAATAQRIAEIPTQSEHRYTCGISECDRVLGGGVVPGSLVLIGGDPGIGKSTLLLQIAHSVASEGKTVLYVSGEESASQIKLRAERLDTSQPNVFVLAETDLDAAQLVIEKIRPDFLIIDSIQTIYRPDLTSAPGSVAQVRECTAVLLRIAKAMNVATFIVGHVTKDGNLAGPRMLEHMVDAVLYFEGERHHMYRVLRAAKNRFGSTNELAIFEMKQNGLEQVQNPSEMFLSERKGNTPGSAVVAALEGSRPLLLEVQALVAPTSFGTARRMATGADYNRMSMIMAVLERRLGMSMQSSDAYINIAGGVRVDEPAIDLGVALALCSSFRDLPLLGGDVYIGEVGLTGEVRTVARLDQRIQEAEKLGFSRCLVPSYGLKGWRHTGHIEVIGIQTVTDAMRKAF